MIKAKHGGQYKQVGFIKVRQPDGTYEDVEKKYGKTSRGEYGLVFEKGFTRSKEGILPLVINGIGKPLKDYSIYGNIYQSDGVTTDTPQEVKAVGDKTANLINANTIVKGRLDNGVLGYEEETTELIVSGNVIKCTTAKAWRGFVTDFIPVEQGGYFLYHIATPNNITYAYRMSVYDSQKNFVRVTTQSERAITINEGEAFIRVSYQLGVAGTFEISNIMLSKGKTALPYEPYGYKVDVVSRGKNLFSFPETKEDGSSAVVKRVKGESKFYVTKASSSTVERALPIDIRLVAGTYTVSVKGLLSEGERNEQIYFKTLDGRSLAIGTKPNAPITFTLAEETDISVLQCVFQTVHENTEVSVQLELGSEATSYEPYTPPITTPIYLDTPIYKIGDYSDSRGISSEVRAVKELVLTGKENWQLWNGDYFSSVIDRKGKISNIYCTHFINSNASGISYATNSSAALKIDSSSIPFVSDVSELKAWLAVQYAAGTPVTVYYVLATPETKTVEPVEILTLNGSTVIDVDTEVKPSNVYIKYKSKT